MRKTTYKQRLFAKAYPKNAGNGAKAAREAGYSDKGEAAKVRAAENVTKSNVVALIEEETKKALEASNLTREDVADMLINEATSPKNADSARGQARWPPVKTSIAP